MGASDASSRKMRANQIIDLAARGPPLEPADNPPVLDQEKRRHFGDGEPLYEPRMAICVELDDA